MIDHFKSKSKIVVCLLVLPNNKIHRIYNKNIIDLLKNMMLRLHII